MAMTSQPLADKALDQTKRIERLEALVAHMAQGMHVPISRRLDWDGDWGPVTRHAGELFELTHGPAEIRE